MPETENTESTEAVETTEGQEPEDTTTTEDDNQGTESSTEADTTTGGIDDLPDWAQKELKRLRAEAGKDRTAAKEKAATEARKAAEAEAAKVLEQERAANAERLKRIARELGLAEDEKSELTPEQMVEKITAERDAEKTAREEEAKAYAELAREVAIQDAANMHDARADRLLDSRTFMRQIRDLDPKAEGFRAAVAEAVEKAVEADGDLKVTRKPTPPAVSGGTTVAGSKTRSVDDMTIEELIEAGYTKRR